MNQIGSAPLPQVFDIKPGAGGEEFNSTTQLTWAVAGIGATPIGIAVLCRSQTSTALGAESRVNVLSLATISEIGHGAEHLWNHVTGLADSHAVPDEHALSVHFRRVV